MQLNANSQGTQRHDDDYILYMLYSIYSLLNMCFNRHFPDFPLQILLDIFSLFRASSAWQCCHPLTIRTVCTVCTPRCWARMGSALSLQNKYCAECNQRRFCFEANLDNARTDCKQFKINVLIPEGKVAKVDQKYNND